MIKYRFETKHQFNAARKKSYSDLKIQLQSYYDDGLVVAGLIDNDQNRDMSAKSEVMTTLGYWHAECKIAIKQFKKEIVAQDRAYKAFKLRRAKKHSEYELNRLKQKREMS